MLAITIYSTSDRALRYIVDSDAIIQHLPAPEGEIGFMDLVNSPDFAEAVCIDIETLTPRYVDASPPYADLILDYLLRNRNLDEVLTNQENFFNPEQWAKLDQYFHELPSTNANNSDYFRFRRWGLLGATLAATTAILTGQAFLWMIGASAIGGLLAYPLTKIHNKLTQRNYQTRDSMTECSATEKAALKLGVAAGTSWKHYLISFKEPSAYRHPNAFRTAMRHAEEKRGGVVRDIHRLR